MAARLIVAPVPIDGGEQSEQECADREQSARHQRVHGHHAAHQRLRRPRLDQALVHVDEEATRQPDHERQTHDHGEAVGEPDQQDRRAGDHHRPLEHGALVGHVALCASGTTSEIAMPIPIIANGMAASPAFRPSSEFTCACSVTITAGLTVRLPVSRSPKRVFSWESPRMWRIASRTSVTTGRRSRRCFVRRDLEHQEEHGPEDQQPGLEPERSFESELVADDLDEHRAENERERHGDRVEGDRAEELVLADERGDQRRPDRLADGGRTAGEQCGDDHPAHLDVIRPDEQCRSCHHRRRRRAASRSAGGGDRVGRPTRPPGARPAPWGARA